MPPGPELARAVPDIREVVIPCAKVGEGMFPDERFVEVASDDGARSSGYADARLLVQLPDGQIGMRATRTGVSANGLDVVALKFRPDDGVNQARFARSHIVEDTDLAARVDLRGATLS